MSLHSVTVRDPDRLTARVFDSATRTSGCRLEAYREGDTYVIDIDLPGVDPASIDVMVDRQVLTVRAERKHAERPLADAARTFTEASERKPAGVAERQFADAADAAERSPAEETEQPARELSRQVTLSNTLDTDRLEARHDNGVLTLTIPLKATTPTALSYAA